MSTNAEGDWNFSGTVLGAKIYPGPNTVNNASIPANADIDVVKMRHRFRQMYGQAFASAPTAGRFPLHLAGGAGVLEEFKVRLGGAVGGSTTVTFDLYKNGSTILTAPVTIVTADGTAFKSGAFSSASYSSGDMFELNLTISGANPGTGPATCLEVTEQP